MNIESFDAIFYAFLFVIPGYIIEEMIAALMPMNRRSEGMTFIHCLGYSIFNYAIWFSWGLRLLEKVANPSTSGYWAVFVLAVLGTSVLTGITLGYVRAKGFVYHAFKALLGQKGINLIHPIPTAWNYYFSRLDKGAWVTVRMDNDMFIRGWMGEASMASSDPEYRDIYIQEQFMRDEGGSWTRIEGTDGVWISADAIKHIEFLRPSLDNGDCGITESDNNMQKQEEIK